MNAQIVGHVAVKNLKSSAPAAPKKDRRPLGEVIAELRHQVRTLEQEVADLKKSGHGQQFAELKHLRNQVRTLKMASHRGDLTQVRLGFALLNLGVSSQTLKDLEIGAQTPETKRLLTTTATGT